MIQTTTAETSIAIYDSMVLAIDRCYRVDEVKDLRDKAMAFETYAKQAQNIEAERKAIEVRIRAERRAGQLLQEMERAKPHAGPGRGKTNGHVEPSFSPFQEAKREANISDTQAKRWQRLAEMPRVDFENPREAEIDENTCRKDFSPQEIYEIGQFYNAKLTRQGTNQHTLSVCQNLTDANPRDVVAKAVGVPLQMITELSQ